MNDLNFIKKVAKTKKPMIISTGLANLNEIKKPIKQLFNLGAET